MYLFPHNDEWISEFEKEKNSIISAYEGEIEIFHIGSTAIKGLYAKDCIDLLGIVKNISEVSLLNQSIINLGYVYKGEYGISGREYFSKKQRKTHLHIYQTDNTNALKHFHFVKVMQGNIELITELNQIKKDLHAKYPFDKESYQKEKEFFYRRINEMI